MTSGIACSTCSTRRATLEEAKAEADRQQALADQHGNPWGYHHHVSNGRDWVYRTAPAKEVAD